MAETFNEVLVELKPPPQKLFRDSPSTIRESNYLRFRLSPHSSVAVAARVKSAGKEFVGERQELFLVEEEPGERLPYERLLEDALSGDPTLFTREDTVEAAWSIVDPVIKHQPRSLPYKRGSWGPKEADTLIAKEGGWQNPSM
jgi:glucose-6-phosphate 1-dehydrogenase